MTDWRVIPSWPAYEASDGGAIRRLGTGRPLKAKRDKDGVLSTWLHRANGKPARVGIHALVCEAFHGPRPTPAHRACMLDGTRSPTAASVAWLTRKERARHRRAMSHGKGRRLDAETARRILSLKPVGLTKRERRGLAPIVASAFGCDPRFVLRVWGRERWPGIVATDADLEAALTDLGGPEVMTDLVESRRG